MTEHLGDLSATIGRGIPLSCHHCDVAWVGCAAASECPRCGSGKGYYWDDHNTCYCPECQGVDTNYEAAASDSLQPT